MENAAQQFLIKSRGEKILLIVIVLSALAHSAVHSGVTFICLYDFAVSRDVSFHNANFVSFDYLMSQILCRRSSLRSNVPEVP